MINKLTDRVYYMDYVQMGDSMYLDMYNGPWKYTKENLYPLLDELLSYDSDFYVPAHHDKYNNEEFKSFVKYIKEIGDTVGDCTDLEKAVSEIKKLKNVDELSQFEIDDIKGFVEGNKVVQRA